MPSSFFRRTKSRESEFYARIRDDSRGEDFRQRLETMWSDYQQFAPKGFPNKLQFEFHQRWWEMYLTLGINRLGFSINPNRHDNAPDLHIQLNDSNVWIEAVAPKSGTASDAVPQAVTNGCDTLPMRECLLRFTQAITSKRAAFDQYISNSVVSSTDCLIIAVSACDLNSFGTLLDFPQPVMIRVLAGAGDLVIHLDDSDTSYSRYDGCTHRDSGNPVDLDLFQSPEYNQISGVLYSRPDPLNAPIAPEETQRPGHHQCWQEQQNV